MRPGGRGWGGGIPGRPPACPPPRKCHIRDDGWYLQKPRRVSPSMDGEINLESVFGRDMRVAEYTTQTASVGFARPRRAEPARNGLQSLSKAAPPLLRLQVLLLEVLLQLGILAQRPTQCAIARGPRIFTSSGQVNCPCGKVLLRKTLGRARRRGALARGPS